MAGIPFPVPRFGFGVFGAVGAFPVYGFFGQRLMTDVRCLELTGHESRTTNHQLRDTSHEHDVSYEVTIQHSLDSA